MLEIIFNTRIKTRSGMVWNSFIHFQALYDCAWKYEYQSKDLYVNYVKKTYLNYVCKLLKELKEENSIEYFMRISLVAK